MESTGDFVKKVHDTQQKDEKNKQRQGGGQPQRKLPGKQHSYDK
ncbi:DUF4023 domain-containing protein [Paenibacillus sp. MBLB4367]